MNYVTPEMIGISSDCINNYIDILENKRLATHSIIMARGDNIFYEQYWKPFDKDFLHRMYSVSKSFVALAIGFLLQDGKISLEDTMEKYFEKELESQTDKNMHNQSIRDMLTMCTAKPNRYWFDYKPKDRVAFYFENDTKETRPPGTIFRYDSDGSFVLGALIERITGIPFMEYLREKLFEKIDVSKEAYCLKCPGGHSWGDSGVLCKPSDLLKVARFIMNGGTWKGKRILDEKYLKEATLCTVFNNYSDINTFNTQGYGFKIWGTYHGAFFLNGMGCQYAICVPEKDLILIYNGDNQGKEAIRNCIVDEFFQIIVNNCKDVGEEVHDISKDKTLNCHSGFNLIAASGLKKNNFEKQINNVTYFLEQNPMGIERFKLSFDEKGGIFHYKNAQGEKAISFGRCENVIETFPEEGYSNLTGTVKTKDFYYKCACSAAWVEPQKIYIKVQIIDKYFGNLSITIGFKDNCCGIYMEKNAEDFLKEYQGFAGGTKV